MRPGIHSPHPHIGARPRLVPLLGLAALPFLAFGLAIFVSVDAFDRVPHSEDELAYLFQARTLAQGLLYAPAPALPDAFEAPFIVVHDGRWFGKYPPGFPALLALGVLADLPWLVNPLLSSLAVALVYLAGRRLYGEGTALVAALLAATSPFLAFQAGSMLSHVAGLVWAMLLLLGFESARRRASALAALGAGAALGALFITRPLTGVAIGAPYLAWAVWMAAGDRGRRRLPIFMAAGAIPFVVAFLAYNSITTGHPLRTGYELWWPYDRIGFGAGMGHIGGHTPAMGLRNSYENLRDLSSYLFGSPWWLSLVPAAIALFWALFGWVVASSKAHGLRRAGVQRRVAWPGEPAGWDLLNGMVVACLVAAYAAYWATGALYGPRYYFEALGALALLSARGLGLMVGAGASLLERAGPAKDAARSLSTRIVGPVVLAIVVYGMGVFFPAQATQFRGWYGIDGHGPRLAREAGATNALVFVQWGSWTDYAPFFAQNRPTLDGEVVYARDRGLFENARLMALYPDRSYYLFSGDRLVRLHPPDASGG